MCEASILPPDQFQTIGIRDSHNLPAESLQIKERIIIIAKKSISEDQANLRMDDSLHIICVIFNGV